METQDKKQRRSLVEEHHVRIGPILGVMLILLVIILGGLYLWGSTLNQEVNENVARNIPNNEPETPRANADAQILSAVSSSDSLEAIETDIESTDLSSLTSELDEMEREIHNNSVH